MLKQDNARSHIARIVHQYRHEVGIIAIVWPAKAPDLFIIEWGSGSCRSRVLSGRGRDFLQAKQPTKSIILLFLRLVENWDQISTNQIDLDKIRTECMV